MAVMAALSVTLLLIGHRVRRNPFSRSIWASAAGHLWGVGSGKKRKKRRKKKEENREGWYKRSIPSYSWCFARARDAAAALTLVVVSTPNTIVASIPATWRPTTAHVAIFYL
jgi:hypothetical protein